MTSKTELAMTAQWYYSDSKKWTESIRINFLAPTVLYQSSDSSGFEKNGMMKELNSRNLIPKTLIFKGRLQNLIRCLLCARLPETWARWRWSESLPRTPCHIWCTRRSLISLATAWGARRGVAWVLPQERSGCQGPDLKGGPTDTDEHTWVCRRSRLESLPHPAVVRGHCCPLPAEVLQTKHWNWMTLL